MELSNSFVEIIMNCFHWHRHFFDLKLQSNVQPECCFSFHIKRCISTLLAIGLSKLSQHNSTGKM